MSSYPILTTSQYDPAKYTPLGSVLLNNVESISLVRSLFASIGGLTGGKNTLIQEAVDRLQTRGMDLFKQKIQATYPNTVAVVGFTANVSEAGRDDQGLCMVLTLAGTCLAPLQNGLPVAVRRETRKRRRRME